MNENYLIRDLFEFPALQMFPDYITDSFEWQGHIPFAFWMIKALKPSVFVELGSYKGDSYMAFCQAVKEFLIPCQCHAIDSWAGDEHVGEYGDEVFEHLRAHHDSRYASFSRLHRMFFNKAVDSFEDGSIDLLHIDGLHTYDAVKNDYETWLPKMSEKGVILFHDSVVKERGFGVWELIEELKQQHPTFTFNHSNGLSLMSVGRKTPKVILEITSLPEGDIKLMQNFFHVLGDRIQSHTQAKFWQQRYDQVQMENNELQYKANFSAEIKRLAEQVDSQLSMQRKDYDGSNKLINDANQKVDNLVTDLFSTREMMAGSMDGIVSELKRIYSYESDRKK